jgi:hypothetical protein
MKIKISPSVMKHSNLVQITLSMFLTCNSSYVYLPICEAGRLGGLVVSVLATGPKGCGFEPGQGNGF